MSATPNINGEKIQGSITGITLFSATTISGGTFYGNGSNLTGIVGGSNVLISGGTFDKNTSTLTFTNTTGGTFNVTGLTDFYTTGFTFNPSTYDITIKLNDNSTLTQNLSVLASDVTITGGTYNSGNGTATFTNNTGGTFDVTGFLTGFTDIYTTGGTYDSGAKTIIFSRTDNNTYSVNLSAITFQDVFVTGASYNNNTFTFTNNTGGTFNTSFDVLSGLTINGNLSVTGTTSSGVISATTYQNLPSSSNISYSQITANTTTTNLTYTDVAGLSVSASTIGVYEFTAILFTGSDTTAGMRIGMSVPASSSDFYYMVQGTNSAAANQTFVEGAASGTLVTTFACNSANNQTGVTRLDGIVTTTQSGDIKVGFAKITSGTATIRAGSFIRITKIA